MAARLRGLGCLFCAVVLLAGCTRERPAPAPTAAETASTPAATLVIAEPKVETVGGAASTPEPSPTALTPSPEPTATRSLLLYTVAAGDTLSAIAGAFNLPVQQLRDLNNLIDDTLFAGQILYVPEGEPTPTPEPFRHVVQPGESLYGIALQYGVTSLLLVEVNSIQDPNNLTVGTALLIPGVAAAGESPAGSADAPSAEAAPEPSPQEQVFHQVQPNETLSGIAALYGVAADALLRANDLADPDLLQAGQKLLIPGLTQTRLREARAIRHTVEVGESLSAIASRYGVSVDEILAANDLVDPDTLLVGQTLLIPQ